MTLVGVWLPECSHTLLHVQCSTCTLGNPKSRITVSLLHTHSRIHTGTSTLTCAHTPWQLRARVRCAAVVDRRGRALPGRPSAARCGVGGGRGTAGPSGVRHARRHGRGARVGDAGVEAWHVGGACCGLRRAECVWPVQCGRAACMGHVRCERQRVWDREAAQRWRD
eukprot:139219-Chlamydomonas_euryale.AAC.3